MRNKRRDEMIIDNLSQGKSKDEEFIKKLQHSYVEVPQMKVTYVPIDQQLKTMFL